MKLGGSCLIFMNWFYLYWLKVNLINWTLPETLVAPLLSEKSGNFSEIAIFSN